MKPIIRILTFAILFLQSFSCANLPSAQSNWQKHKPKLDEISNLSEDSAHLLGAQNIIYTVSNDSGNLYIKMVITDRRTQMEMMHYGFNIWIDTTGHKKQNQGITYPLAAKDNIGAPDMNDKNQNPDASSGKHDKAAQLSFKKKMIQSMVEMDITGFTPGPAVRIPASGAGGLGVSLLADSNGSLQYKAIIPFYLLKYHPNLHAGKKSRPLSIGLVMGKPEETGGKYGGAGAHGGSFGPGGGMGGGMNGGGGMPEGGHHGGGGGHADMDEGVDTWVAVKLAGY
jgi:hypothetical protein